MAKHPKFRGGPAACNDDFMTEAGARKLAGIIRAAWAKVGIDLPCEVSEATWPGERGKHRGAIWIVRMPTLVNGLWVAPA